MLFDSYTVKLPHQYMYMHFNGDNFLASEIVKKKHKSMKKSLEIYFLVLLCITVIVEGVESYCQMVQIYTTLAQ